MDCSLTIVNVYVYLVSEILPTNIAYRDFQMSMLE